MGRGAPARSSPGCRADLAADEVRAPLTTMRRLTLINQALDSGNPSRVLLALLARLEGEPWLSMDNLAAKLGLPRKSVGRVVGRLRRSGVLRTVALASAKESACQCIVYLRTRSTDQRALAALEDHLIGDPSITMAAQVTGGYDYRIEALVGDIAEAQAWFRGLLDLEAIGGGTLQLTRTVFKRFGAAAAMLGSDPSDDFDV